MKLCKLIHYSEKHKRIGESHGRAKLTDDEVDLFRKLVEGGMPVMEAAAKFGLSKMHAYDIANYRKRATAPAEVVRLTVEVED